MARGKVKVWNDQRGYGFIGRTDENAPDVFAHVSELPPGLTQLREGDHVEFDVTTDRRSGKPRAVAVRLSSATVEMQK